jgi:hypothetical protein
VLRDALAARADAVGIALPAQGTMRADQIDKLLAAGQHDPAFLHEMTTLTALGLWDRTRPAKVLRGFAKQAHERKR